MRIALLLAAPLLLAACSVTDVVTAPVRAVGQTADWLTTSQDEADRNRGRELRKQEERDRKAAKKAAREERRRAREAERAN